MRRKVLLACAGVVLLLGASWFLFWRPPRLHIDRDTFDRIEIGMTPEEVRAIMGAWEGRYASVPVYCHEDGVGGTLHPEFFSCWWGDDAVIEIEWADWWQSRVRGKRFLPVERIEQTPFENLCWRAKEEWRRRFGE